MALTTLTVPQLTANRNALYMPLGTRRCVRAFPTDARCSIEPLMTFERHRRDGGRPSGRPARRRPANRRWQNTGVGTVRTWPASLRATRGDQSAWKEDTPYGRCKRFALNIENRQVNISKERVQAIVCHPLPRRILRSTCRSNQISAASATTTAVGTCMAV
jgi:hypothetical protein